MTQKKQHRLTPLLKKGVIIFVLLCMALFFLLPKLTNTYILPTLLSRYEQGDLSVYITDLGLFKTSARVALSDNEQANILLPRIDIEYSPASLFQKKISTLTLSGGIIHLRQTSKGLELYNSPAKTENKPQLKPAHNNQTSLKLLFAPVKTIFKDCSVIIHQPNGQIATVLLSGKAALQVSNENEFQSLAFELSSQGDVTSSIKGTVGKANNQYLVNIAEIHLAKLQDIETFIPRFFSSNAIDGEAFIQAAVHLNAQTFAIENINSTLQLPGFKLTGAAYSLSSNIQAPRLRVEGTLESLQYQLSDLVLKNNIDAEISLAGDISLQPTRHIKGTGAINLTGPFEEAVSVLTEYEYLDSITKEATLSLTAHTEDIVELSLDSTKKVTLDTLSASFNSSLADKNQLTFKFVGRKIEYQQDDIIYTVPNLTLTSEGILQSGRINGDLKVEIKQISDSRDSTRLQDMVVSGPFSLPLESITKTTANARFSIGKFVYQKVDTASLSGTLSYKNEQASLKAQLTSPLDQNLYLDIEGKTTGELYDIKLHVPKSRIELISFQPLLRLANPPDFSADIEVDAEFTNDVQKATLTLNDGNMSLAETALSINDINTAITFDQLPRLNSRPSQNLTAATIEIGDLNFSNASIKFRIEDPNTLFIEKSQLGWCGGKVETGSLRLQPKTDELETTLYCDRLNFGQLLMQLGIQGAEGNGSLNGRLPVIVNQQGVFFDDGFLFSTPGENGILHFTNTKMLQSGMPDLDQAVTLNYSMQALEDFTYDWSRLKFKSQKDKLTLTLELKGQPSSPLPFAFKNGQMVKDEKGSGLQYPVRLDLNFNLPQEDIFRFGKNLQKFKENL